MDSSPPAWRVFDEPASSSQPSVAGSGSEMPAAPAGVATHARRSATQELLGGSRPMVIAGLAAAAGGIGLAIVLAMGGLGGGVTFDAADGQPLGSAEPSGHLAGGGQDVVVDVAGAVLQPGVYHLVAGARVADAIAAAGGYSPRVAAEVVARTLNLAAVIHDGDLILVPSRDDPVATGGAGSGGGGGGGGTAGGGSTTIVDLNHGSAEELDALPGIGPVTAAKIIASRIDTPFTTVDELLSRKLVGQKVFDQIRALVAVR
jgi:competence protein ComEA